MNVKLIKVNEKYLSKAKGVEVETTSYYAEYGNGQRLKIQPAFNNGKDWVLLDHLSEEVKADK